jgi:3,4-dihydroxy 2-butanone 4-phosphate synthase / GTP cyclohydrolase II
VYRGVSAGCFAFFVRCRGRIYASWRRSSWLSGMLTRVADAKLPIRIGTQNVLARAIALMDDITGAPYFALVLGDLAKTSVLVRVHSGCLTGDVFGSLRCDCGDQLSYSLQLIDDHGAGVVIYAPAHEGRGIGLVNKIRAYGLQDEGLDTVDANLALGVPVDGRQFSEAAAALKLLGVTDIELLTNNPMKVAALAGHGLTVRRRAMPLFANSFNAKYLATKQDRLGHLTDRLTSDEAHV